jgi:hypothetical protein
MSTPFSSLAGPPASSLDTEYIEALWAKFDWISGDTLTTDIEEWVQESAMEE